MKNEWKKGDKLRLISDDGGTGLMSGGERWKNGAIVIADEDCDSTVKSLVYVVFPNGHREQFNNSRFEKITTSVTMKVPTHVVLWNESSRDPHQFFTSLESANKFIKELIDRPNTIKDSIVLVEIKKVEKIVVNKLIRKNKFMI